MATQAPFSHRVAFVAPLAWALTLSLAAAGAAFAQSPARSAAIRPEPPVLTAESLVVDQLVILTRQTILGDTLSVAQLEAARELLDLAMELDADNAELWRLWIEWSRLAGNDAAMRRGFDAYTRLRPEDDRAALSLIRLQILELQTVEERIELLEKLMVHGQDRLGPALRSRLASMAAQLAFDLGDDDALSRYLPMALSLDATNAQAADLLLTFVQSRDPGDAQLGRALLTNIQAAPMLWTYRAALGTLLLQGHAFSQAARQFEIAQRLAGAALDDDTYWQWAVALGWSGDPAAAVALLDDLEQHRAAAATDSPQPDQATPPQPTDAAESTEPAEAEPEVDTVADPAAPVPAAESVDGALSHRMELLRLVLLNLDNRQTRIRTLANRVRARLEPSAVQGDREAIWQLGLYLAMAGVDLGYVGELADRLPEEDDSLRQTLLGWRSLKSGQPQEAAALFETALGQSPQLAAADLGLALAQHDAALGDERLRRLVEQAAMPGDTELLAASRLAARPANVMPLTPAGQRLLRGFEALPVQIHDPRPDQERWAFVQMSTDDTVFAYLEPIPVTVTLQNISRIPLSLQPGGTVPTAMMVQIATRVGGSAVAQFGDLVVDLGRRIRLEPNETVTVQARLDWSQLGELLAGTPTQTVNIDAVGLLDLRAAPGGIVQGPFGTRAMVRLLARRGGNLSEINIEAWLRALDDHDAAEQLRALARLTHVAGVLGKQENLEEPFVTLHQRMIAAVNERYPRLDRLAQAMVLRFLPHQEENAARPFEAIHGLAQRSEDPLVRIMYLAANMSEADDPALGAAMRSPVEPVARFAEAWADVLFQRRQEADRREAQRREAEAAAQQAPK